MVNAEIRKIKRLNTAAVGEEENTTRVGANAAVVEA